MNPTFFSYPTVLSIAGFDGSGGAGIQADTKTISALGCYATNVLTALPVQNTQGVCALYEIPVQAIKDQLEAIFNDIYPDSIKIGMLNSLELVHLIKPYLENFKNHKIILDPVMVSTSGHQLVDNSTIQASVEQLFPLASLITPNLDEANILTGRKIQTPQEMIKAGNQLLEMGCQAVLMKGGHLKNSQLTSFLIQPNQEPISYTSPKIDTKNTHGSGCSLSSAIASYLALNFSLEEAVEKAQAYIFKAIDSGKNVKTGKGNGPLNHFFAPQKLVKRK